MPWTSRDAKSFTHKASTPAAQKQWSKVANTVLKQTNGNESKAVRIANAAVAKRTSSRKG